MAVMLGKIGSALSERCKDTRGLIGCEVNKPNRSPRTSNWLNFKQINMNFVKNQLASFVIKDKIYLSPYEIGNLSEGFM